MAALLLVLSPLQIHAQNYSFELTGSFEPSSTPHMSGTGSILVSNDNKEFSITSITVKGPDTKHLTFAMSTGMEQLLLSQGRFHAFVDAQGGIAKSDSVVSGLFMGGPSIVVDLYKDGRLQLVGRVRGLLAPADGGGSMKITAGIRFKP